MAKKRKNNFWKRNAIALVVALITLPLLLYAVYQQIQLYTRAADPLEGNRAVSILSNSQGELAAPIVLNQSQFTAEAWVRIPKLTQTALYTGILFFQKENNANDKPSFTVWYEGSATIPPKFRVEMASATQTVSLTSPSVTTDMWQHVAIVKTASTVSLYINSTKVASQPFTTTLNFLSPTAFQVGAKTLPPATLTPYGQFNGIIEEVRISSNARYVINGSRPTKPFATDAYTLALYHLDGNTNDSSGKGKNAVTKGVVSFVASGAPILGNSPVITSVTGLPTSTSTNQKIPLSFVLTENDGTPARASEGFVFRLYQRLVGSSSTQSVGSLIYDTTNSKWNIIYPAPLTAGSYILTLTKTCNPLKSICDQRYPAAIQLLWTPTLLVTGTSGPTVGPATPTPLPLRPPPASPFW